MKCYSHAWESRFAIVSGWRNFRTSFSCDRLYPKISVSMKKVKHYQQYCDVTFYSIFLYTDRFIRNLILIIVLPLTLAALFIFVVCVKFRPTCKSSSELDEVSNHAILVLSKCHNFKNMCLLIFISRCSPCCLFIFHSVQMSQKLMSKKETLSFSHF